MGNQGSIRMGPSTTPAWKGRYPTYEELDEWTGEPAPLEQLFPWQFITRPQREQRKLLRELKKQRDREGDHSPSSEGTWRSRASIPPEDGKCYFKKIPREILVHVLQYVGEETLSTACLLVNRQFNDASQDENLWRHLYLVDVGRVPPLPGPPDNHSNSKWHRKGITSRQEYYYKMWRWYESYGGAFYDVREERFPDITKRYLASCSLAPSPTDFLDAIHDLECLPCSVPAKRP